MMMKFNFLYDCCFLFSMIQYCLFNKSLRFQLEEVIRTTKDLQEKEDENERLHQEVEDLRYMMEELRAQIEEKDSVIEEYREFINEQQSQLTAMRRQTATSRSEAERFKVSHVTVKRMLDIFLHVHFLTVSENLDKWKWPNPEIRKNEFVRCYIIDCGSAWNCSFQNF